MATSATSAASAVDNATWGAVGAGGWEGPNATLDVFSSANISLNGSAPGQAAPKGFCLEWEAAQHYLLQTANLFFAAAFVVPRSFKQSLLLLRALLCVGFLLAALWAGLHVCAPDVFAWNCGLVLLNALHAALLAARHLPPPLSLELAELYLKLFKPLRVSRKHFKELTREGQVLRLAPGDTYAVEDVTAADERLSVLLRGKLRVTCDDTHLHYISPHQFIDSPEWEANHDTSDDVFQVTITAEQECVYMCWPRIKLERVLRHRPLLKTVIDNIIGKDITHKLYSLNEQLALAGAAAAAEVAGAFARPADHWRRAMSRSLSVDAVHTGTRGHVRSLAWRQASRRTMAIPEGKWCSGSPGRGGADGGSSAGDQFGSSQRWAPVVTASHFPATSPFAGYLHPQPAPAPTLHPHAGAAEDDEDDDEDEGTELMQLSGPSPPLSAASLPPAYAYVFPSHGPAHAHPPLQRSHALPAHYHHHQQISMVPLTKPLLGLPGAAPGAGPGAAPGAGACLPSPPVPPLPPINSGAARQRSVRREVKFESPV